MRLVLSQVVGQPSKTVWSQVVILGSASAKDVNLSDVPGGVMILGITVRDGNDAVDRGAEVLDWFEEAFGKPNEPYEIEGLYKEFKRMSVLGVEVVGVYTAEGRVIIFGYGGGRVVLKRGSMVGVVFEAKEDGWLVKEGEMREGDVWLVGTQGLVGEMSKGLIEEVLSMDGVEEAGQELVTLVQAADGSAEAAGLLMQVMGGEQEQERTKKVQGGGSEKEEKKRRRQKLPTVHLRSTVKRRKMATSVGIVLLVLLLVSIGLGRQKIRQVKYEERFEEVMSQVEEREEKSIGMKDDNPLRAKQLVVEAQEIIENAKGEFAGEEEWLSKLDEKDESLKQAYVVVSGEVVSEAQVWYELSLIREGMYGSSMDLSGTNLYVLDKAMAVVGVVEVENKKGSVAVGGDLLGGAELFDVTGLRAVVLASGGVVDANLKTKTTDMLVEKEDEWGEMAGVGMFSGNVYLLDVSRSEIWRYPAIERGVGGRQRWLKAGFTPDLSGAVDMAIDGDVWVLQKSGTISRFRRGNEEGFSIEGMGEPIGEAVAVFTTEDVERLYVLDREKKRVVVVSKNGVYEKQYFWEGLAAAEDLVVDEDGGVIYVLVGSTIYSIPLE